MKSLFPSIFERYDTEFTNELYGDAPWIEGVLEAGHPQQVLDIACGTGRASWFALERGAQVTGLDTSLEALDLFNKKAQKAGFQQQLKLETLDINQSLPEGQWDLIMLVGNSLGVIESKERLKEFFLWAHAHLNQGGSVILSQTFPENGFAPLEVELPPRSYQFKNLDYQRTVIIRSGEEKLTFEFRYFQEGQPIHEDIMTLNYFPWPIVKDFGTKIFGEDNARLDFKFEKTSTQNVEPYEVFYQFIKA